MGGVTTALASAARSFGAEVLTDAAVGRITTSGGAVTGVVLEDGRELRARTVVTTTHPQISFLRLLDRADLPADFVRDIERWHSRSGVVKVNLALDRLPEFASKPGSIPRCMAARSSWPSRSTTSRAPSRTPSPGARRRHRSPTSASRRCSTTRSPPTAST
jgi:phytoene dehydrogenase-like protein